MKHVGVYIEGNRKYVLVRTEGISRTNNVAVYHYDGDKLNPVTSRRDKRWPHIFFGLEPCECNLKTEDITPEVKAALGVDRNSFISISGMSISGMYNHMGSHTGNAMGDMQGMYNHMGSKMSGVDAGFRRGNGAVGNEMFADMA